MAKAPVPAEKSKKLRDNIKPPKYDYATIDKGK